MHNLSLHPLWYAYMPAYQHSVCIGTLALSSVALYIMHTRTPTAGAAFARYLMLLQVSITLVDLNFGFLFCPIGLAPVTGGLCNGILCSVFEYGGHIGVVLMYFTCENVGVSVILCFHFKFVTILGMVRHRPVSKSYCVLVRVAFYISFAAPCFLLIPAFRYQEGGPEYVRSNYPSLYYLFEDPNYHAFAYDPRIFPEYAAIATSALSCTVIMASASVSFFTVASFYLLSRQTSSMSEKTRELQRKMILMLLVQTIMPQSILTFPMSIHFYSMTTGTLSPDINNITFSIQLTYAFLHTSTVILTTPSYRKVFIK